MKKYLSIQELYVLFINCQQKITTDTRKLENGSIFFALKGDNFDANEFAEKAIEGGCAFAIVDNENNANHQTVLLVENVLESLQELAKYHRQQLKCVVVGITGSNGKTTNKELIHAVLSKKYNTYATKGNLNNHIGVPLTLLSITSEHQMAIVEMGANHQGEIEMLSNISDPDYGIITNIGKAHLEGFGGIEGVKKGKSELYKHLKKKNRKVFVNGDDEVLVSLSGGLTKVFYGENPDYDIYGKSYSNTEYVEFKWAEKQASLDERPLVKTQMFGHYNFINLLCATTIGHYFGVNDSDINSALSSYIPEMNRSQVKKTETNTVILDAYNANPSSMSLSIENFEKQALQNKALILGDMLELGEYSEAEHERILQLVNAIQLQNVFLVGGIFKTLNSKFSEFHYFETVSELKHYFMEHPLRDHSILVKGSRGIQLEKVVENL